MNNKKEKITLTIKEAADEAFVQPKDVLEEIIPLMQEYFVGEVVLEDERIVYRMPNGQILHISAQAA